MTPANSEVQTASLGNLDLAKKCLQLISDIALRGLRSNDSDTVGYALQELSQVMVERTGAEDRFFEPVSTGQISDLVELSEELDFVDSLSQSMDANRRDRRAGEQYVPSAHMRPTRAKRRDLGQRRAKGIHKGQPGGKSHKS